MKINALLSIVVLPLAVLGACDPEVEDGTVAELETVEDVAADIDLTLAGDAEVDAACQAICKPCPPDQVCTQVCQLVGNCTNKCDVIALCAPGYDWDETACQCLPQTGQTCGDISCPPGTECCNASCGICVEPGGFCTQQICASE